MTNEAVSLVRRAVGLGPLQITPKQKYLALALASVVDVAQMTVLAPYTTPGIISPIEWAVDIATSVILVFILGWNWRLLLAFAVELIPMATMFPTWSALILTITATAALKDDPAAPRPNQFGAPQNPPLPGATPDLHAPPAFGAPPTINVPSNFGSPPVASAPPEKFPGVYHKRTR